MGLKLINEEDDKDGSDTENFSRASAPIRARGTQSVLSGSERRLQLEQQLAKKEKQRELEKMKKLRRFQDESREEEQPESPLADPFRRQGMFGIREVDP